jgi:hypothetical protein
MLNKIGSDSDIELKQVSLYAKTANEKEDEKDSLLVKRVNTQKSSAGN